MAALAAEETGGTVFIVTAGASKHRGLVSGVERTAGDFVAKAKQLAKAGDKKKAIAKLREAQKIVPRSSSAYKEATSGIAKLGG